MVRYKYLLHAVEEIQEGQLGTAICDCNLKDWDKSRAKSVRVQYKLLIS